MDNPCYERDASMELEILNIEDNVPIEKEKKRVNFEKNINMKTINTNTFGDGNTTDPSEIQQITNDFKPYPGYCQPDACRESSRSIQHLGKKNAEFDNYLKFKMWAFFLMCIVFLTWVVIHFGFFI